MLRRFWFGTAFFKDLGKEQLLTQLSRCCLSKVMALADAKIKFSQTNQLNSYSLRWLKVKMGKEVFQKLSMLESGEETVRNRMLIGQNTSTRKEGI